MKKHVPISALCALALAAATPASAGVAYLSRTGSGTTCSLAAPCAAMITAISAAGANGEVICLDKGNYGATSIVQSVTISCGDGLWEDSFGSVVINPAAGSDVIIEGLVLDGNGAVGVGIAMGNQGTLHLRRVRVGNAAASPAAWPRLAPTWALRSLSPASVVRSSASTKVVMAALH